MATVAQQALPRLLVGVGDRTMTDLDDHLDAHGPLPNLRAWTSEQLIALVETSGLRGHGGIAQSGFIASRPEEVDLRPARGDHARAHSRVCHG